jgi:hypothetical protein
VTKHTRLTLRPHFNGLGDLAQERDPDPLPQPKSAFERIRSSPQRPRSSSAQLGSFIEIQAWLPMRRKGAAGTLPG